MQHDSHIYLSTACSCAFLSNNTSLQLIKDRTYHLKTYKKCFKGDRLVDWLLDHKHVASRAEVHHPTIVIVLYLKFPSGHCRRHVAAHVWRHTPWYCAPIESIRHVTALPVVDDHNFKDEPFYYRFRLDDESYRGFQPGYHQVPAPSRNWKTVQSHNHPGCI